MTFPRIIPFLLLVLTLTSCETVYFYEAQPEGKRALESLPRSVYGTYPLVPDGTMNVVVDSRGISVPVDGETKLFTLGEDVVLKKFAGHYILSLRDHERWDVYAVDRRGTIKQLLLDKDELYKIDDLLGEGFVHRSRTSVRGSTIIDPTPRQFKKLLKHLFVPIEDGLN